jgi:hypothetical protein
MMKLSVWHFTVLIITTAVLLGYCFHLVPEPNRAEVFTQSVASVTGVFNVNLWMILTIVFGMTSLFLFILYLLSALSKNFKPKFLAFPRFPHFLVNFEFF